MGVTELDARVCRYQLRFVLIETWRLCVLLVSGMEPAFDVPIVNVTVVAGQTAVLPCSIEYLGKYKVSMISSQSSLHTGSVVQCPA